HTTKDLAHAAPEPDETAKKGCHPAISCGSASTLFSIRRLRLASVPATASGQLGIADATSRSSVTTRGPSMTPIRPGFQWYPCGTPGLGCAQNDNESARPGSRCHEPSSCQLD